MSETLVFGEMVGEVLSPITGELFVAARTLGKESTVVLIGNKSGNASREALDLGFDRVYVVECDPLLEISNDYLVSAFEQVCRKVRPFIVLFGKTLVGKDVGPRVAFRLGVGVAQDCIDVSLDSSTGRIVAVRPVYGGSAYATVTFTDVDPQMVVVRSGVFDAPEPDSTQNTGQIIKVEVEFDEADMKVRHVETVREESQGVRLEDASVVVAGGRGLGGAEPFRYLEELAALLGGAVGASRAATDAGWIEHSLQIGLTGKTIAPNLYITVGISGASQHMAGCSASKNIIAVNDDRESNIFKESTYGVVGDWREILPAFIETVRDLRT